MVGNLSGRSWKREPVKLRPEWWKKVKSFEVQKNYASINLSYDLDSSQWDCYTFA